MAASSVAAGKSTRIGYYKAGQNCALRREVDREALAEYLHVGLPGSALLSLYTPWTRGFFRLLRLKTPLEMRRNQLTQEKHLMPLVDDNDSCKKERQFTRPLLRRSLLSITILPLHRAISTRPEMPSFPQLAQSWRFDTSWHQGTLEENLGSSILYPVSAVPYTDSPPHDPFQNQVEPQAM